MYFVSRSKCENAAGGLERYEVDHQPGGDVPAWPLDTDWNGLSFHVSQPFFPRTGAWDSLKRLRADFEESVCEDLHSCGAVHVEAEGEDVGDELVIRVRLVFGRRREATPSVTRQTAADSRGGG